jgi:hypothetical protein
MTTAVTDYTSEHSRRAPRADTGSACDKRFNGLFMRLHLIVTIGIVRCVAQLPSGIAPNSEPWKRHTIDASSLGADGVRSADVNAGGVG